MADRHEFEAGTVAPGGEAEGSPVDSGAAAPASGDPEPAPRPKSVWLPAVVPLKSRATGDHDDSVVDEWPAPRGLSPRHPPAEPGWKRWLTGRAAAIAAAAALGGLLGAGAATGVGQVLAARDSGPDAEETVLALRTSIGQLATEIKSLKDSVGESSRVASSGLAALDERIESAEQAQGDLTEKIAGLSEGLSERTLPQVAAVSPETTGSVAPAKPPVARDWVLWRVRNGRALVQGNGGYFEVVPGSSLPGLGLVQRITKQNGRWVVLTRNGIIVARG